MHGRVLRERSRAGNFEAITEKSGKKAKKRSFFLTFFSEIISMWALSGSDAPARGLLALFFGKRR